MKRWILAMAALLAATVVLHADYIVLTVNLALTRDPQGLPRGPMAQPSAPPWQGPWNPAAPQLGYGLQAGQGLGGGGLSLQAGQALRQRGQGPQGGFQGTRASGLGI